MDRVNDGQRVFSLFLFLSSFPLEKKRGRRTVDEQEAKERRAQAVALPRNPPLGPPSCVSSLSSVIVAT